MSFDKLKAMKNAERFLSQGKLRAAISEYRKVVDDNPKDFSTLNIMGDLYVKNSETKDGVNCYKLVAEHYFGQGFANKAIAIYNKIAKLEPDSMIVAERLGQLYQTRGSFAEAREQYLRLAEFYQGKGRKLEALEIWKRIAELDPNNTEVYITIGDTCVQENQTVDAVDAYTEAGIRLNAHEKYEAAIAVFLKALDIQSNSIKTLRGYVAAKIGLGCADEAAETLEGVLTENPYSREILLLLTDCYLDMNSPEKAEETVIKLVQQEPSYFPKFLEIVKVYMKDSDLESTVRVLSISFEHILGAGLSGEFESWINEVLARNPEFIEGLRLLVKFHSWHRDPVEIRKSLERLVETARATESVEDERFALGQLISITPLQTHYTERLDELRQKYGVSDSDNQFERSAVIPEFESFRELNNDEMGIGINVSADDNFEQYAGDLTFSESDVSDSFTEYGVTEVVTDFNIVPDNEEFTFESNQIEGAIPYKFDSDEPQANISFADEQRLEKEIESVEFYLSQGYTDLAVNCLDGLQAEFGHHSKLVELRQGILDAGNILPEIAFSHEETMPLISEDQEFENDPLEFDSPEVEPILTEIPFVETAEAETFEDLPVQTDEMITPAVNVFEQFRNDLGLQDIEEDNEGDYSTLYHTAIAYKEMGLMEDAIKEFQDAINMVEMDDGTRRYFQCANLLGHCFMVKGMPNLAQTWFKRALETSGLIDEEIQALHYELASAYEASGEKEKAFQHFEQVYALDVDYRDIGQRIQNLREHYSSSMIN